MTFSSNFKKKKSLIGLTIVFIIAGFVITIIQFSNSKMPYLVNQEYYFDETKINSDYYSSRATGQDFLLAPQIDSDIVESRVMQLFIPIYKYELNLLEKICGDFSKDESQTKDEQRKAKREWYLNCYNEYNEVFLNGERIVTDFSKYRLPETNQFGIVNYINLESAVEGKNSLRIMKRLEYDTIEWNIPFQYISRSY